VIDGSDNFATRYLVNDACVLAGKPFVYGAIHGFEGQASVFNWQGGPTYRCLFPEPPEPGSVPNCQEAGVLGVLPGFIGTIQATEALKLLTGIGESLSGRLLLWDALTMNTRILALAVDPHCRDIRELPPEGYGETCARSMDTTSDEVDAQELRRRLPDVQLIDVREAWEREAGAILPSLHVPLGLFVGNTVATLLTTLDPARPTVVYCAHGMRSLRALAELRMRHGFNQAWSLRGGYEAWRRV
jgi:adenylyltransferase/sulfurtransferase